MVFHEALLMSGKVYCDSGIDFVIVEQTQIKIWINYTQMDAIKPLFLLIIIFSLAVHCKYLYGAAYMKNVFQQESVFHYKCFKLWTTFQEWMP